MRAHQKTFISTGSSIPDQNGPDQYDVGGLYYEIYVEERKSVRLSRPTNHIYLFLDDDGEPSDYVITGGNEGDEEIIYVGSFTDCVEVVMEMYAGYGLIVLRPRYHEW